MDSLIFALDAVFPFLLYAAYGYIMRRAGVLTEDFLKKLNRVIFIAFYPFITFNNTYKLDPEMEFRGSFVLYTAVLILVLIGILMAVVPRIVKEDARRGVVIQAIYRSNAVLFALPLSQTVFGDKGGALAAMMLAVVVPLYNVSAVILLEHFSGKKHSPLSMVKNVVLNPLVIGVVFGFLFYLFRIRLPHPLAKAVGAFSDLATPIALFALGGTLQFSRIGRNARCLFCSLFVKLFVIPAAVFALTAALGFGEAERFVVFSAFATPTASVSYTMAQQMNGDGELAAQFVVLSTAGAALSLFLWLTLLRNLGMV